MAIGRFERKIVAAIAAVAFMPLLGALVLGQRALREAYAVGVNEQVEAELERGLNLYQRYFAALREDATRTALAVAHDFELGRTLMQQQEPPGLDDAYLLAVLDTLLARYPNVVRLELLHDQQPIAARDRAGVDAAELRLLNLDQPLPRPPFVIRVTVGTDARAFGEYQRAGEVSEVFSTLKARSGYVSGSYLAVYIGLLLSVIAVALGVGVMLSRRVTRRVTQLAQATARVGAGDLTVSVPADDSDEVGELSRAFNEMVRDMRESRERIEYLSRIGAWQEFARRLAHEIKNPLTPIQLAVQEIHRSYKGDDSRFRRLLEDGRAIVEEEIATLRRLVSEFSEFARLPEAHLSPADLGVFVREALGAQFGAEDSMDEDAVEVAVRAEVEPGALPVRIDPMLLKRCLDNLIRNAAQALRAARTPNPTVIVAARAAGGRVVLEVRDNGPGIAPELRERVFDPYYTTKSDGTGLGLAIVKKIVLEHEGEIVCAQAPEGGAALQIWLPFPRASRSGAWR
jgi:two-component system, NtrC family, nitrogen regulation sensor histidine kinase NtrY